MKTQKQIAAPREDGSKSHTATTPEGKARIANANLPSGVFAETQLRPLSRTGFASSSSNAARWAPELPSALASNCLQLSLLKPIYESLGVSVKMPLAAPHLVIPAFSIGAPAPAVRSIAAKG